jgi:pimeloyl-ACP methyl ester carboxylesterase
MTGALPLPGEDRVVGGMRLHVVSYGWAGGRLPLLLLHGVPTCGYLWHGVMRDLGHQLHCTAPDLAGLGRSERPGAPLALARQAALLLELMDQLGYGQAVVVGHDVGGAVGVHLTALAPERVAGLVLVSSPLHREIWPPIRTIPLLIPGLRAALLRALRLQPDGARRLLSRALGVGSQSALDRSELDAYLAPLLRPEGGGGLVDVVAGVDMVAAHQAWELVRAAPPRTLVLWGEDDPLYSASYGRRIAAEVPGAGWVPVSGSGHLLPHERPERVAEELAAFVGDLPAAARG